MNRFTLLAASALLAAALWGPAATAQPNAATAQPNAATAATAPITFDQYRDFRLQIIARRQESLALRLAGHGLAAEDKARLERQKAYYDRWAALPAATRDRLFRERFDEIDTDRDGTLDVQELTNWRRHQREYYRQLAAARARLAAAPPSPPQH